MFTVSLEIQDVVINGTIPLFTQLPVLLLICCVRSEQLLQVASVSLHILVVDVDVVQPLLFLKDFLCCALKQMRTHMGRNHFSRDNRGRVTTDSGVTSLTGHIRQLRFQGADVGYVDVEKRP